MTTHTFGELLKKYRTWREMKQRDLAICVKCGRNTISNWERGSTKPSRAMLLKIGDCLSLDVQDKNQLLAAAEYPLIPLMDDPAAFVEPNPPQPILHNKIQQLVPWHFLPRAEHFTGRQEQLAWLMAALQPQAQVS